MRIPEAFIHPLYYKKTDSISISSFDRNDIITIPFKYDIAYYQGAAPHQLPWEIRVIVFHSFAELESQESLLMAP